MRDSEIRLVNLSLVQKARKTHNLLPIPASPSFRNFEFGTFHLKILPFPPLDKTNQANLNSNILS